MSKAKRTRPRVAITMAKLISPTYVLVERFCPRELHIAKYIVNKKTIISDYFANIHLTK